MSVPVPSLGRPGCLHSWETNGLSPESQNRASLCKRHLHPTRTCSISQPALAFAWNTSLVSVFLILELNLGAYRMSLSGGQPCGSPAPTKCDPHWIGGLWYRPELFMIQAEALCPQGLKTYQSLSHAHCTPHRHLSNGHNLTSTRNEGIDGL